MQPERAIILVDGSNFYFKLRDLKLHHLIPAIQKAQEKGKTVIYVGFSHQVSRALVDSCKETQTLTNTTATLNKLRQMKGWEPLAVAGPAGCEPSDPLCASVDTD